MSDQIILVDSSVIYDICQGNRAAALQLREILRPDSGYQVHVANYANLEMTGTPGRYAANAPQIPDYPELAFGPMSASARIEMTQLLEDINLRPHPKPPLVTDMAEVLAGKLSNDPRLPEGQRREFRPVPGVNDPDHLGRGTRFNVPELNRQNPRFSARDARVAAEAHALGAKIWTVDTHFRNALQDNQNWQIGMQPMPGNRYGRLQTATLGNLVATEFNHIPPMGGNGGPTDIGYGRRLLGISTRMSTVDGYNGRLYGARMFTNPVHLDEINARGQAVGGGSLVVLGGLSSFLNDINEANQRKEIEKQLAAAQADIRRRQAADPTQGVLVLIHFQVKNKPPQASAAVNPDPRTFTDLSIQSGRTISEARINVPKGGSIGPGSAIQTWGFSERPETEEKWFPPLIEPKLEDLSTPWKKIAIATFAPGKTELQQVEFAGTWGFDDEHSWRSKLSIPEGKKMLFFVLRPPPVIKWAASAWAVDKHSPPMVSRPTFGGGSIQAVDLDPDWPIISHTAACPVFPADQSTEDEFSEMHPTIDNGNILYGHYPNFNKVRWVRPENMVLLASVGENGKLEPTPEGKDQLDAAVFKATPAAAAAAGGQPTAGPVAQPKQGVTKSYAQLSENAKKVMRKLLPAAPTTVESLYQSLRLGIPATNVAVSELVQERKVTVIAADAAGNIQSIRVTQTAFDEMLQAIR